MKKKHLFLFAMSCGLMASMTSCDSEEPTPVPGVPADSIEMTMPENSEVRTVKVKIPKEMKTRADISMNDFLTQREYAKMQNWQVAVAVYVDHGAGTESGYHLYWNSNMVVDKEATSFDIKVPHPCDLTENGVKLMVFAKPTWHELIGDTGYSLNLRDKNISFLGANTNRQLGSGMSAGLDCFFFYDIIPDGETFEITLKRPLKQYVVMSTEPIDNPSVLHDMLDEAHSNNTYMCTDLVFTDGTTSESMYYPYVWNFDTGEVRYQSLSHYNSHFYSFCYDHSNDEFHYTATINGKKYAILGSFYTFTPPISGTEYNTYDNGGENAKAITIRNMRIRIGNEHGDGLMTVHHEINIPIDTNPANSCVIISNDPESLGGLFSHEAEGKVSISTAYAHKTVDIEN